MGSSARARTCGSSPMCRPRAGRAVRSDVTWSSGQGVVEYGLILALTSLFTVLILVVFGGTVSDLLRVIAEVIDGAT